MPITLLTLMGTCLFIVYLSVLKNEFKGKGHASSLIGECIKDAKSKKIFGVAVM